MQRAVWLAVLFALIARVGALAYLDDPLWISRVADGPLWNWGYEQAAVGRALARGEGFADAFGRGTGATGWAAPVYPLVFAALSKLCGGVGETMAWALALVQIVASALTCVALAALARGLGRRDLAAPVAWAWAVYPPAIWFAVTLVWDSTFVALGVATWLAALACAGRDVTPARAFRLGCGLGALALVNPAPLAFAPAVLPWLRGRLRSVLALAGGAALVLTPWVVRNQVSVGAAGLRTNLGVELMVGNNDLAEGGWVGALHPSYSPIEIARFDAMGEAAYAAEAKGRALRWIRAHPGRFLELCGTRLRRFWIGLDPFGEPRDWMGWIEWVVGLVTGLAALAALVLWRGAPGSGWLVRGVLLLFPLVYVVTHVLSRYRYPIDGVVVLAGMAAVSEIWRRFGPGVAGERDS